MNKQNIGSIAAWVSVVILALNLTACRTFVPPHTVETPFPGLANLATNNGPCLRVFLIQGMSKHDPGWSTNAYLNPMMEKLGMNLQPGKTRSEPVVVKGTTNGYSALLTRYTIADRNAPRILAYELTWSPLVEPFKSDRFAADINVSRPVVNAVVRNVIDLDLADVVLYLSKFDDNIMARSVSRALAMFYNGELDNDSGSKSRPDLGESPVVFFSESLGSKMLFDAVTAPPAHEAGRETGNFDNMLKRNDYIFMMANQLTLLDMPAPETNAITPTRPMSAGTPKPLSGLASFAKMRHESAKTRKTVTGTTPPLFVIAFSDTYDVLSYQVNKTNLPPDVDVIIDNFTPANAFSWFGICENPESAHTHYGINDKVINTVVHGYP